MNDIALPQGFAPLAALAQGVESSATAVAAQAKAMVEARYVLAMHRPRNWDDVRQLLIKECRRPAFAKNKSAFYRKPIGDGVEGLGIRFAEVALRCMTNVLIESTLVFEDAMKEIHKVTVTDLEGNVTYPHDVRVEKTVERARPMSDGSFISVRKNSYGKDVFTVPAQEDDLLNKRGAQISKAIRTLALRIIPGDLQDEAEAVIKAVRMDEAARDPNAERNSIADAFMQLNILPSQLSEYLGQDFGACSPAQMVDLRGLYGALRDGEATWATVMENKAERDAAKAESKGASAKPEAATFKWTDDAFAAAEPTWRKALPKKGVEGIIAMAETKAPLSEDQKKVIRSWATPVSESAATQASAAVHRAAQGEPTFTEAQIAAKLDAAADMEQLAQAGSLISSITDPKARNRLSVKYDERGEILSTQE